MYRNSCYCKLKKLLEELKREIKKNYSSDPDLANRVQLILDELDANTQRDEELANTVNQHLLDDLLQNPDDLDLDLASINDIDTLFS